MGKISPISLMLTSKMILPNSVEGPEKAPGGSWPGLEADECDWHNLIGPPQCNQPYVKHPELRGASTCGTVVSLFYASNKKVAPGWSRLMNVTDII